MSDEVKKTKEELFAEDPDKFIHADDLIIAIMRTADGPAILCAPRSRQEAIMARGDCDVALLKKILEADLGQKKVVPAKGGIISAARNRLFK